MLNFDLHAGNGLNGREDAQVEDKKPAKVKAIEKGSAEVETGEVDTAWVY